MWKTLSYCPDKRDVALAVVNYVTDNKLTVVYDFRQVSVQRGGEGGGLPRPTGPGALLPFHPGASHRPRQGGQEQLVLEVRLLQD